MAATSGAAIEVPLQVPQPPGTVLVMASPGAAMRIQLPQLLNDASRPCALLAATEISAL